MTDCIIVGSGVAGISAALTLKANGKSFLLFGSPDLSEKIEKAERIRNYPGLSNVTGKEFVQAYAIPTSVRKPYGNPCLRRGIGETNRGGRNLLGERRKLLRDL